MVLAACCLAPALVVHAQEVRPRVGGVGGVAGHVIETDGTPIPSVAVVLRGPAPARTVLRTRADAAAFFLFGGLTPGVYELSVQFPGLEAPRPVEVVVEAGTRVNANVILSLFAYDVEVQVVGRTPLALGVMDLAATSAAYELGQPLLESLPLAAERALGVLPMLPGVVAGPDGLVSIGGSLPTDSAFLLNGADLIDAYSGVYRLDVPLEAVESVRLYRGAYDATYGDSLGGAVDVTTMGAGDTWRRQLASLIPRPWFRDGKIAGIKRFDPRLRFGGPIVPGRLYVAQALGYHFDRERIRDTPGGRGDHLRFKGWNTLTELDWRPPGGHRARLVLFGFPQTDEHAGLSGLTPEETASAIDRRGEAFLLEHRYRFDDQSYLTSTVQGNWLGVEIEPSSSAPGVLRVLPDRFEGSAFHSEDRVTRHWQLRSVYTRALGPGSYTHLVQAGAELHGLATAGTVHNRPIEILGVDGTLLRRIDFLDGGRLEADKRELALFVQERWRPSNRFWLDFGVRASHDGAGSGLRLAPRLGVAWDVRGDTRTLLKASAGLLHRRIFLGEAVWEQMPARVESTLQPDGTARVEAFLPQLDERIRRPRAWALGVELSHRVTRGLTLHARFERRVTRERLVFDLLPGAVLSLAPGADPVAAARALGDSAGRLLLANDGRSTYTELELTAAWHLESGQQVFVSWVGSDSQGDINDFSRVAGELPDAILRPNQRGPLPLDTPSRLVFWASLKLPWELVAAPVLEWRDGFPYSDLTEGQEFLGAVNTRRFPSFLSADLSLTKGFRLAGHGLRAGLQVLNLTGHFNPRDVIANTASARVGTFLNDFGRRIRIRFSTSL